MSKKVENNKDQLILNFNTLDIPYSEEEYIFAPFTDTDENIDRGMVPLEIAQKNPFFLHAKSKKVLYSRSGMKANKLDQELMKKGYSEEERRNRVKYDELSPVDLNKDYGDWKIKASAEWGLPDSFDGLVWDVIIKIVSDTLHKTGNIYYVYTITPNRIESELIKRGVYKSRSGKTAKRIKESLYRLKNTSYIYEKGALRKDTNKLVSYEKFDFSLITNIYEKGEVLPPDTSGEERRASQFKIAINNILVLNLRKQHYLIILQKRREALKEYESITLFYKLCYFLHIDIRAGELFISQQIGMNYTRVFTYGTICKFLGLEPKKGANYKKAKILEQLTPYHDEIKTQGIIENIIIKEKGTKRNKEFKFIYIYKKEFLAEVLNIQSKRDKLQEKDYTPEERSNYIGKVQKQIGDIDIVKSLFD